MARPERTTVDYFPFYCDEGKKMFYIEETYGNDGFATFIKILRELAKTENHYLNLNDKFSLKFLSAKCKINTDLLELIINDLADFGKFDKNLWNKYKIVWCQDFVESIQDAYLRRNNKCITLEKLYIELHTLSIIKLTDEELMYYNNSQASELMYDKNTQRKEKDIKENKTIIKEIDFSIFSHFKYSKETIHVYNFIKQNLNLDYLEIDENWFIEFEKMVKEDERTPQEFNHCFNVLKNNEFYKPIVKDIFKLRKHFAKLLEQKIKVVMENLPTKPLDKTGGVWVNNKYTGKAVYCPYNPNVDLTDEINNVKLQKPKK